MIDMIDLKLAESYQPAIIFICKVSFIYCCLAIGLTLQLSSFSILIFLCTVMYLDHSQRQQQILDSNVPTACILCSLIVNHHREKIDGDGLGALAVVWNLAWMIFAIGSMFVKPPVVESEFSQLCVASFLFLMHSWSIHADKDSLPQVGFRLVFFTMISIIWMYVIDIRKLSRSKINTFTPCVLHFSPILFLQAVLCHIFCLVCGLVVTFKYHYRIGTYNTLAVNEDDDIEKQKKQDLTVTTQNSGENEPSTDESEVYDLFKAAKQNASQGSHMS